MSQSSFFVFLSLPLLGFIPGVQLREQPSPVKIKKATHEKSQEWESARIDLSVVSRDLCCGAPRLVRIDEHHNLEVQS